MTININRPAVLGLLAGAVIGFIAGTATQWGPKEQLPVLGADRESTKKTMAVLDKEFPGAFPSDSKLIMGGAYGKNAMRLFLTTSLDYLDAVSRCRENLPKDWVEVPIDRQSVAFISELRGAKQTTVLVRGSMPVRYEISTEGSVGVKASRLARLDGTGVDPEDLGRYLIRL